MSLAVLLQDFKVACDVYNINKEPAIRVCKHYLTSPVGSVSNVRAKLPTKTSRAQDGRLASYYAIGSYLSKRYVTGGNIAMVDVNICTFTQQAITATDYVQEFWTRTLWCRSIYKDKALKVLFVKVVNKSIHRTFSRWYSEHQSISLEDLALKAELLMEFQHKKPCMEDWSDVERSKSSWEPLVRQWIHPQLAY